MEGKRPWDLLASFFIRIDTNASGASDPFKHFTSLRLSLPEVYEGISWDNEVEDSEVPDLGAPFGFCPDTLLGGLTQFTVTQCDRTVSALLALLRWRTKVESLMIGDASRDGDNDDEEPSSNFLSELVDKGVLLPVLKVLRLRNVDRNHIVY
ncbi:hypothetical protein H1R20_g7403, partial [Candolleomyces eurysporus]